MGLSKNRMFIYFAKKCQNRKLFICLCGFPGKITLFFIAVNKMQELLVNCGSIWGNRYSNYETIAEIG